MSAHTFVKRKYNPAIKDFLLHISENPHPNFPVIAEIEDDFYVMEYVEGNTLSEIIAVSGVLLHHKAKNYILQLIEAVSQMHKFKIVHRDIKPENIIITEDDTLKLIDFDISRKIIAAKNCDTELLGTAGYAAPEQFGFSQTDERSDIYAIGIVYNFMLTGKPHLEKSVDGQIGKIIERCTRLDKTDRYKSINHLRKDISSEHFTTFRLFDILPGFRSRSILKMIIAIFVYLSTIFGYCFFAYFEMPREDTTMIVICSMIIVVFLIYVFLFFSIATNFLGITNKIKFPVKNKKLKTLLLLVIQYVIGSLILYGALGNLRDAVMYNPVSITVLWLGFLIYSLIIV